MASAEMVPSSRVVWPTVVLGEVARLVERPETPVAGKSYRQAGVRLWGQGAYEREPIDGGATQYKTLSRVEANDIIVNKIWARNGSVSVVQSKLAGAYVSGEFPTFVAEPDKLLPQWFFWLTKMRSFWEQCDELSRGTSGKNRIRPEKFLQIQIPLPPLDEQHRIVACVEELARRIEEARGLREETRAEAATLWTSALRNAFAQWQGRPGADLAAETLATQADEYASVSQTQFNGAHPMTPFISQEGLYSLPSTWIWTDLGSVLTHLVDCVNDTPDFADSNTGFLGLKSTNVRPYQLDLSTKWYVTEHDFARWNRREKPRAGDLILTREAPVGNVCMLPDGPEVCLTQRLMLLRTDARFVMPEYMLYYLNSPLFQSQVLEQCRGLTTPHIRVKDAPFLLVPLPPPSVQQDIVAYLHDMKGRADRLMCLQHETSAELEALLPSVLNKAFRGEL